VTVSDREAETKVQSFHEGPALPKVAHMIYSDESSLAE
jgi:hypothetical protein